MTTATPAYNRQPAYPPVRGSDGSGWSAALRTVASGTSKLAVDGPALLDWDELTRGLTKALEETGTEVRVLDARTWLAPWPQIVARTTSPELADDPHFAKLAECTLADLFDQLPTIEVSDDVFTLIIGPGAALLDHDLLWYADLPKRYAEDAITKGRGSNLGQPSTVDEGAGTSKRLFYLDWPILDAHRDAIADDIDLWIDTQQAEPTWLPGAVLRATLADLATRPFRTRPTFNTTVWGGHWAQEQLGFNPEAANTALGYELIAPESGILVGSVEVPFQLLVAKHPRAVLGEQVHETFGTSFPVRFDYLDTAAGGANLSVHCHPQSDYMRDVFGWPYTQHETYYVMVGDVQNTVFLGLRDDVDVDNFHAEAHAADSHGAEFDVTKHVQTFPAEPHQLFLIPAGTPHGSGAGNVVLEISATPYLYSLRFYDWLRHGSDGSQRPVHVEHAFRNLNVERRGPAVGDDLVQKPRTIRTGADWHEELIGSLPEMFFEVYRSVLDGTDPIADDTAGRFHILNVVEGAGVTVTTKTGTHHLAYAETLVIPAAVGEYTLTRLGPDRVRVVKAAVTTQ